MALITTLNIIAIVIGSLLVISLLIMAFGTCSDCTEEEWLDNQIKELDEDTYSVLNHLWKKKQK